MGLLDDAIDTAAGPMGDADSVLGGKSHTAGAADAKPRYGKGKEDLGQPPETIGGAIKRLPVRGGDPTDKSGKLNKGLPIEFIHFCWVHPDHTIDFDHQTEIPDDQPKQLPTDPPTPQSRAILFRAALEREAILLFGFVSGCQAVLKEKEAAEGFQSALDKPSGPGLGDLMKAGSDLLGSTGGSSAPKAADLNSVADAVKKAAGNLNVSSITYKLIHQAGVDLNQARANYRAFLDNLQKAPAGKKDAGTLSNLPGVGSAAAGVASAIGNVAGALGPVLELIQGIVFKAFDIYVAAFTELAEEQEYNLERACHDLSIKAIQTNQSPIFPVWFIKNDGTSTAPASSSGAQPPLLSMGTGSTGPSLGDQLKALPGKVKDQAADTATKDINDFLELRADDYWSQPFLNQAFSLDSKDKPDTPKNQPPPVPKAFGAMVVKAFKKALGLEGKDLGFAETLITFIMEEDADFLEAIYQSLLAGDNSQPLSKDALYAAARKRLLERLVGILMDKLTFLQTLKDFSLPFDQNKGKQGGKALDKGLDVGMDELNQRFGKYLDPVLKAAMSNLIDELEAARQAAVKANSMTMEVYLGLQPRLLAMLFRDTFFPLWDLLVKEGCPWLSQVLGGPLGSAAGAFKSARKSLHSARNTLDAVKNTLDQPPELSGDLKDGFKRPELKKGNIADDADNPDAGKAKADFPFDSRKTTAKGEAIKKADLDAIEKVKEADYVDPPKYQPPPA